MSERAPQGTVFISLRGGRGSQGHKSGESLEDAAERGESDREGSMSPDQNHK